MIINFNYSTETPTAFSIYLFDLPVRTELSGLFLTQSSPVEATVPTYMLRQKRVDRVLQNSYIFLSDYKLKVLARNALMISIFRDIFRVYFKNLSV